MKTKKQTKTFLFLGFVFAFFTTIPTARAQTIILSDNESYDFLRNTKGEVDDGDFYYGIYEGQATFWANNKGQRGLQDLGDIGIVYLDHVTIPETGYTRFNVTAINNHTYVSLAQEGDEGSYIIFRVNYVEPDQSKVYLEYLYKPNIGRTIKTTTYVETHPKQITLGDQISLIGTIEPNLPQRLSYRNLYFRVTQPDKKRITLGPLISHYSQENNKHIVTYLFTPTQEGTYNLIFYTPLEVIVNDFYESSFSQSKTFTVHEFTSNIDETDPTPNEPDPTFELSDFQEFLIIASITFVIIVALIMYILYKLRPKPVWSNKKRNL